MQEMKNWNDWHDDSTVRDYICAYSVDLLLAVLQPRRLQDFPSYGNIRTLVNRLYGECLAYKEDRRYTGVCAARRDSMTEDEFHAWLSEQKESDVYPKPCKPVHATENKRNS